MVSVKQEAVNTNFTVTSLTGFGIKLESAAADADALTTRPSELSIAHEFEILRSLGYFAC